MPVAFNSLSQLRFVGALVLRRYLDLHDDRILNEQVCKVVANVYALVANWDGMFDHGGETRPATIPLAALVDRLAPGIRIRDAVSLQMPRR